jgi:hypothetical protein
MNSLLLPEQIKHMEEDLRNLILFEHLFSLDENFSTEL